MTKKPRNDAPKLIDHERREGHQYAPKPPESDETKRKRSEAMKAFNKRTGKVTALANFQVRRRKKPPV